MYINAALDRLELGDHVCCPVTDPRQLLEVAAVGVACGLREGQKLLFFVDDPDRLKRFLAAAVAGAAQALETHQLQVRDGGGAYASGGGFDVEQMLDIVSREVDLASAEGYPGLRSSGDLSGLMRSRENAEAIVEYEVRLNAICAAGAITGICHYGQHDLTDESWDRIRSVHPTTILPAESEPDARLLGRRVADGIRLEGEADLLNRAALPALLAEAAAQPGPCHIDASDLTFADARAIGWLLHTATARGDRLTTITCRSQLAEILDLCGALTVPSLTVTSLTETARERT